MHESADRHPRGLYTLFFTEMWERLSYYGMRGLLVLFMVDTTQHGGLGLSDEVATAIYGLYTAGVYLSALPGGWLADRLLGGQRAVWWGGCLIAAGHFTLAVPRTPSFFLGLILVVLGTGLLKPNISTLVGQLYPEGGARRDAGFTLFYMGINLGAAIGPLVCSLLGEKFNWHYGFAAAGIGMVIGLIQYRLTRHNLGDAGLIAPNRPKSAGPIWLGVVLALGLVAASAALVWTGVIALDPVWLVQRSTAVIVGLAVAYFGWALFFARLESAEKKRLVVILILFLAAALFWSGYEQAGSSLNLFADRYTERTILGFEIPAGWFQSLPAVFVIVFAPVVAALWLRMSRHGRNPSLVVKLAWGLLLLAGGFLVLVVGSQRALAHGKVWPTWLIFTYLLHVFGELLLSPVGLSSVTKLAPARLAGQMMGVWFLAASLGNLLAGLLAGGISGAQAGAMPIRFLQVAVGTGAAGLILLACARPVRRLMGGVN
ncbi:MAG TPA: peptide MFS transporter [Verrucomicrobiota bacterium]|nr:MFS transporter [Verrucomicrobiales bacterium]HRI15772.1 peptide MFS transporter [Verrucomicrobiota bacterium]